MITMFNDATSQELTRKPEKLYDARTCHLHGTDPSDVELVTLIGPLTLGQIDALVRQRGRDAGAFALWCLDSDDVYAVDPQGYDYTRSLGRFTTKHARALVSALEGR